MNIVITKDDKRIIKKILTFIILEFFLLAQTPFVILSNDNFKNRDTAKQYSIKKKTIKEKKQTNKNNTVKKQVIKNDKLNTEDKILERTVYKEIVYPDKPKLIKYKEIILEIPEGAVTKPIYLIIEELKEINNLNPGMHNVTSKALGFRFKPDIKFEKNINITLPFDKDKITSEYELKNLHTYFYSEEKKEWEKLVRINIDLKNSLITSTTNHFTDFINSTLKLPDNPKPLSYNINTIKDIKAANPFTNIPDIEGLESNAYGSANFSIPLTIPNGRKEMQPKLSLNYNSQGGNSWLGIGFSIDVPVIEIDTKFGVPNYDGEDDYLYNGKKLYPIEDDGNDRQYRLYTTEGEFERIIRKGNFVDNCYFEITKKNGTKYIYGNSSNSRLQSYRNGNSHNPPLSTTGYPIYKWYLTRVEDTNGNYISYNYINTNSNPKEIYLQEIRYTGHGSDQGDYTIIFTSNPRNDVILDCRGRFRHIVRRRLQEINIQYNSAPVRKYILNYTYNAFQKSQLISITEQGRDNSNFYTYTFNYYEMPQENPDDTVTNDFNGFQKTIAWDDTGETSLSKSYSLSVGGSIKIVLGLGLGFDSLLGAGGGASYQKEFTNTTLCFMDINGDGLPDYVHPPSDIGGVFGFFNNNLKCRLNNITGLSGLNTLSADDTNFAGFINATQQDDISFFASASAGVGVDGNYNNSRSVTHTTITDVNGDGLPDFIMSPGADSYFKANYDYWTGNSQYAYELTSLITTDTTQFSTGISNSNDMKNALHLTDPVLKWKSYHKGIINITGNVKKTGEDGDGIKVNLYRDEIDTGYNYISTSSLWSGNPTSQGIYNFVNIIKENYDDNTDDIQLSDDAAEDEAEISYFLMDTSTDITIDKTIAIDRLESIYLKISSIKTTKGDIAECDLEIIYEEIELHDFMKEYDNAYVPDSVSSEERTVILNNGNIYEDALFNRHYPGPGYTFTPDGDNIQDVKNRLKELFSKSGFVIPKKIIFDSVKDLLLSANPTASQLSLLVNLLNYYKLSNNSNYFVLDPSAIPDDTAKRNCYNAVKNIGFPSNKFKYKYYTYNENIEYDGEHENKYFIDREILTNTGNSAVYNNPSNPSIGIKTLNGILVDENIWLEKISSSSYRLDKNGTQTITGGYRKNYTSSEDIYLIDSTNNGYDIVYILYNNKTTLPSSIPSGIRNSHPALYDLYTSGGVYDPTTDIQAIIDVSNYLTSNTGIIDYDILVKGIRIYNDRIYNVTSQTLTNLRTEDLVVDWADFGNYSENVNNSHKSYVYLTDLSGRDIVDRQYYIHVFNADRDFKLNNLKMNNENIDNISVIQIEPQEYFSGGGYNWYYGEWNGNFLWDINKIGDEVTDGTDDSKSFRYFVPMYPLNEYGNGDNTADINYWEKDLWHGTTTHYSEKGFDDNGDVVTQNIHETSYISDDAASYNSLEICASKKGADAGSGVTGTIATEGLGGLQESTNESFSFGISTPWGIGINFNNGTSKSYRDFIDMNGDRYPDQVIFDNNNKCNVILNENGNGFKTKTTFSNNHNNLRLNKSYNVGFTLGKGSSIKETYSAYLDAKKTKAAPKKSSFSPTLTASLGHSLTQVNLIDINGDGLPDHVRKVPGDGYDVQLNLGDTFEDISWTSNDWENISGISYNDPTNDDVNNLIGDLNYLQYNNTISAGINIGFDKGHFNAGAGVSIFGSRTKAQLIDMNGDGLPDQVVKLHSDDYFLVKLNMGDRFNSNAIYWHTPSWKLYSNENFYIDNYVLSVINNIIGASSTDSAIGDADTPGDIDVNNSDLLINETAVKNFIENTIKGGENLFNDINPFGAGDVISYGGGLGFNVSFTFKIEIPIIPLILSLYIIPGVNFGYSYNSGQLELRDVDGDGLVDHIFRYDLEDFARVKLNNAKQVGLLREIRTPAGSSISLEYTREGNTIYHPDCTYVLSKVTKTDGFLDGDSYSIDYEYTDGYYDREKRSFCGFNVVKQINPDKTYLEKFYTNEYYEKGILQETLLSDEDGNPLASTKHDYEFVDLDTAFSKIVKFAKLNGTQTAYYDIHDNDVITKEITYTYDYGVSSDNIKYGNITEVIDHGDIDNANDDIYIKIDYNLSSTNEANYIVSNPTKLHVSSDPGYSMGNTLRQRTGTYDDKGNLISLTQFEDDISSNIYTFGYDSYGNNTSMTDPLGYNIIYGYDTAVQTYITSISDNLGYSSSSSYDYRYGVELTSTDINDKTITKTYDTKGRLTFVRINQDTGSTPAVSFDYTNCFPTYTNGYITQPGRVITKNKIHINPADSLKENITLDTILYADGLRRIIQTKKDGEIFNGTNYITGMNVSGVTEYDNMGRVITEYQPDFQSGTNLQSFYAAQLTENPTKYEYDLLGRITKITLPDGNEINNYYCITDDGIFQTKITDPNFNIKSSYADIRGNIIKVEQSNQSETIKRNTNYEYNLLGEITEILDHNNNRTSITYDYIGRMTSIDNPDMGLIEYFYDANGNVIRKLDNNLRDLPGQNGIQYEYDIAGRLIKTIYPGKYIHTETNYTYGNASAGNNTRGRISQITDESGTYTFRYGILGETTEITKTLNRLDNPYPTSPYVIMYLYDYLGRMEEIEYPDGETVFYEYNHGGNVDRVYGIQDGTTFNYVNNIGYDKFGQRVFIEYGNGNRTSYTYNPQRRWLSNIITSNPSNTQLQNITYNFDDVGNINNITNNTTTRAFTQNFSYDFLYQLTNVTGTYTDSRIPSFIKTNAYSQSYTYDIIGNMTTKISTNIKNPGNINPKHLNYNFNFIYDPIHPHRAINIGNWVHKYDLNGNLIERSSSDNTNNNNKQHYDDDSDLGIPNTHNETETNTNESNVAYGWHDRDYDDELKYSDKDIFVWDEENRLRESLVNYQRTRYLYDYKGNRTVKYGSFGENIYVDKIYQAHPTGIATTTKHIFLGSTRIASKIHLNDTNVSYDESHTYYYHPDHLGSSNYITDYLGNVYEHMLYTAYGESWVEETKDNLKQLEYKYTSKEQDRETGLYYFGARYYDNAASRWISCDPAFNSYLPIAPISKKNKQHNNKLPGQGGIFNSLNLNIYNYSNNNPIVFIDPDGRSSKPFKITYSKGKYYVQGIGRKGSISKSDIKKFLKAFHATGTKQAANGVKSGIDPAYYNPASRFGEGFYVASDETTSKAEVNFHLSKQNDYAKFMVSFDMNLEGQKILDLSNPNIAKKQGFIPGKSNYSDCQNIANNAINAGYNVIRVPSYRNSGGINTIILPNVNANDILSNPVITPIP